MTKKSASQLKAVKKEEISLEEKFEECIKVEHIKLDTAIATAKLPKTYVDVRNAWAEFFGPDRELTFQGAVKLCKLVEDTYRDMKCELYTFDLKDFQTDDPNWDPYEGYVPRISDCKTDEDMFAAYLCYCVVRPFATNLFQIKQLVMED